MPYKFGANAFPMGATFCGFLKVASRYTKALVFVLERWLSNEAFNLTAKSYDHRALRYRSALQGPPTNHLGSGSGSPGPRNRGQAFEAPETQGLVELMCKASVSCIWEHLSLWFKPGKLSDLV